jgi:hypothetical protein
MMHDDAATGTILHVRISKEALKALRAKQAAYARDDVPIPLTTLARGILESALTGSGKKGGKR